MIKNLASLLKDFKEQKILLDLVEATLAFLQPDLLIKNKVKLQNNKLKIENKTFNLSKYKNIYVVGAGKATYKMAEAINRLLKGKIKEGYINVPVAKTKKIGKIIVNKATHPLPNKSGLDGVKKILSIVQKAKKDDLVICLISGGGSALMPLPSQNLTLDDKINLTKRLLSSKANIHEINTVRKHISQIKGGRLALEALPATIVSIYISDVIGDDLAFIASGPTVSDKTTILDAIKILKKYKITDKKIIEAIKINESPKKLPKNKVFNFIIGSNNKVLDHLKEQAEKKGYKVSILKEFLKGEAKTTSKKLLKIAKPKTLTIAGGETVVNLKGKGQGGRNQEFALSIIPHIKKNEALLTLATDGIDGMTPKPVAGAIITNKFKNVKIEKYLKNNDSYNCLKSLNCLLETGPSGTNVGDIAMVLKS